MSDIVERANVMLSTYRLAAAKGVAQAYPDDVVSHIVTQLVAEVERLRSTGGRWCGHSHEDHLVDGCTCACPG